MPRVSILIPAHNAEESILDAVGSAQAQTIEDIEIIVIDDASTDRTSLLVRTLASMDPRIRLFRMENNSGPAAARNVGIAQAGGEWIALLDADDTMLPERLDRLLKASAVGDVLVADNLALFDRQAHRVVKRGISPDLLQSGLRMDCEGFVARCRTNQPDAVDFGLLKPLIRASHIRLNHILYNEQVRYGEDFQFYVDVLLAGGSLLVIPEAYYRYTERIGSISRMPSGLSKTIARLEKLEAQTRRLAVDPRYQRIAPLLNQRADAIRRFAKIRSFREGSVFRKFASLPATLLDAEMRSHFQRQLWTRLRRSRPANSMKSSLFRDSSNLCLGQGIKLALQGVYFLCIARSLGPAQYGAFIAVAAMAGIISPYVGLGCGNLFLKNVRSGRRTAPLCWGNGLVTTLTTGILATGAICVCSSLWAPEIPVALIAAICISDLIFTRVIDLASFGFAASGKMGHTAVQNTIMSVLRVAGILYLIVVHRQVTIALWTRVYVVTAIIGALFAVYEGNKMWGLPRFSLRANWQDIREGSFFSVSTSAQTIYNDIDKTMLARLSSYSATGVYAAAYRIIDTSLTPVRSLVSAAYPEFFRIGTEGISASYGYARRLIQKALVFGILDFIGLILIAPLIPLALGPKYAMVAPAIRLLAFIPVMRCVHWFLADALSGADAQALRTSIQVGVALLNVGLNIVVLPRWSWVGAAWTSLASDGALLIAVYLAVQWKRSVEGVREVMHAAD
jgi:O-antigen/teichoic acid export membrane protein/glycosyltransferase involved in cell wall biosynthesis